MLVAADLFAQAGDSTSVPNFRPTGFRLGVDLVPIARSLVDKDFSGWELAADVDFYRFFLLGEFGSMRTAELTGDGELATNGNYYRFGMDVNFIKNDPDQNAFFVGIRIGRSSFSEKLQYSYQDPAWGNGSREAIIEDGKAGWAELVTGLKVKVWKELWMGFTSRNKFGLTAEGSYALNPYHDPGYGLAGRRSYWGFNYYLFYRIPFRRTQEGSSAPVE